MRILHRYIFVELVRVFALALVAITAILVMVGVVQEATNQGLSLAQIVAIVPFVIPSSLPFTIPATLLLAVTIVYGRLAADNEIVAVKSAGINVLYLVVPAVLMAIVLSFTTLRLSNYLIPTANFRMRTAFVKNVEEMVYAVLKRDHMIKTSRAPYEIYVQEVRGRKLINTTVKRRTSAGVYDLIIVAQEAELVFDLKNKVVNVHMNKAKITGDEVAVDSQGNITLPIGLPNIDSIQRRIRDMTLDEIEREKAELAREHEQDCALWAFDASLAVAGGHVTRVRWDSLPELVKHDKELKQDLRRLECEPEMRKAISFGCIFFVLLGCPVAIWFQRGDYLSAFIACFLPIIALYYPLMMFSFNLSKEGHAPPAILWLGNAVLALLAIVPVRAVLRH